MRRRQGLIIAFILSGIFCACDDSSLSNKSLTEKLWSNERFMHIHYNLTEINPWFDTISADWSYLRDNISGKACLYYGDTPSKTIFFISDTSVINCYPIKKEYFKEERKAQHMTFADHTLFPGYTTKNVPGFNDLIPGLIGDTIATVTIDSNAQGYEKYRYHLVKEKEMIVLKIIEYMNYAEMMDTYEGHNIYKRFTLLDYSEDPSKLKTLSDNLNDIERECINTYRLEIPKSR